MRITQDLGIFDSIMNKDIEKQRLMAGDIQVNYHLSNKSINLNAPLKVGDIVDLRINEYFNSEGDFFEISSIIKTHNYRSRS